MKDFYGKELAVGDKVLYGGGYSVIREGLIEKITEKYVSIRAYRDSNGVKTRTKHYHAVTGKWIDPYYHQAQQAGYYHKETGEYVPWENRRTVRNKIPNNARWGYETEPNPDYVPEELCEYRTSTYKDYVKSIELQGGSISILYSATGIVKLPVEA